MVRTERETTLLKELAVEQDPGRGQEDPGFLARGWRLSVIIRGRKAQAGLDAGDAVGQC